MDGLRGFAAVAVLLSHTETFALRAYPSTSKALSGQLAVDVFFVLSGFVMAYTYLGRPVDWKKFAVARFARIYPLHMASCLAILGLAMVGTFVGGDVDPRYVDGQEIAEELLLLSALPGFSPAVWNLPSWSISIEWWMYFTLLPLLAIITPRTGWKTSCSTAFIAYAVLGFVLFGTLDGAEGATRGWVAILRGVIGITAGWALWRLWRETSLTAKPWMTNAAAALFLGAWWISPQFGVSEAWFALGIIPLLIFGLCRGGGDRSLPVDAPDEVSRRHLLLDLPHTHDSADAARRAASAGRVGR